MTESDWNRCTDPWKMLKFLRDGGKLSSRKGRLFAVACCRRAWDLLTDSRSQKALELAERYADGQARPEERAAAWRLAHQATEKIAGGLMKGRFNLLLAAAAAQAAASLTPNLGERARASAARAAAQQQEETVAQAALLRDLFGPPSFRSVRPDPAWLAWNGGTVRRLAEAAYAERQLPAGTLDPVRLAILADALEESGCTDAWLLGHLRSAGPHVRGCFAVDVVLAKE
jgi:hypothetical protein